MGDMEEILKYSKQMNILYVEDNSDAREMTSMVLEDFFKEVTVAVDGKDALEKFEKDKFDVVLTDLNMPNVSGLELCEKIREIDEEIFLIILSAHNENEFFIDSIRIGVDGYLLKPIDLDQLLTILNKVVKKYKYKKELKKFQNLLKEYQKAVDNFAIVSKTDKKGIITYVNDEFCKISGYTEDELIGKNHNIVRHPDNPKSLYKKMWDTIKKEKKIFKGIVRNKTKDKKSYYVNTLVMPILDTDENILEYISIRHDITEIMNPLNQLKEEIKNNKDQILVYMRLKNYDILEEFYNDEKLHNILNEVEKYLNLQFSKFKNEKIFNLSNGEYAVLIDSSYLNRDFLDELKKIQKKVDKDLIKIEDFEYDISILISVVYKSENMFESAKLGLKHLIKNNEDFIIANDLLKVRKKQIEENIKTIKLIKDAIKNSRVVSFFQPIIENETKKIVKYESLIRIIDDKNNVISPFFFLEISKKTELYPKITKVVLDKAVKFIKKFDTELSINISYLDIVKNQKDGYLFKFIKENQDIVNKIIFELVEEEFLHGFNLIKDFIKEVKKFGVKIAIDDFGSGYSNYKRIFEYKPDIIKIDGSLIKDIENDNFSHSMVKSIVSFAKEQDIKIIAEFIENENIYNITKGLGIDFSQGYFFGKPTPLLEDG